MDSNENTLAGTKNRFAGKARAVGLLTAGVVAGGILAGAGIASAATNSASPSPSASSGTSGTTGTPGAAPSGGMHGPGGPGGAAAVRSDEKVVTGDNLATLTAAALKAVPGGTIVRVETDAGDGAFEAHLKKADGTVVTVKFDKNLSVTKVEDGMGQGDPAPAGQPGAPAGASSSSGA